MSVFPTKILLATDGSEEAELAALTAVELAKRPTQNSMSSTSGAWNLGASLKTHRGTSPKDTKLAEKNRGGFAISK